MSPFTIVQICQKFENEARNGPGILEMLDAYRLRNTTKRTVTAPKVEIK
jgi:hypothetical protein